MKAKQRAESSVIFKSAKCRPHAQLCSHFVKMICFKNQLVECIMYGHKYSVTNTPAREDHGKNHSMRTYQQWPLLKSADVQASPATVGQSSPSHMSHGGLVSIAHPEASDRIDSLYAHFSVCACYRKCGSRTSNVNITWELDRQNLNF